MKEATHTPGPWRYAESRQEFYVSAGVGDDPIDTIAGDVYGEANARLIAAAPDLLACLEWAVKNLDTRASMFGLNKSLEAIARANGTDK